MNVSSPSPLILVGASVRAAAQSARRAGFRPWALDQFADGDLRELGAARMVPQYPQDLPSLFDEAPDAPWLYTGGLENHPDIVEALEKRRPLWGNSARVLRQVRDPFRLRDELVSASWPALDVHPGTTPPGEGAWIVKPLRSAAGIGARAVDLPCKRVQPDNSTYFQRRLPDSAVIHGVTFVMARGKAVLLGACRHWPTTAPSRGDARSYVYRGAVTARVDDHQRRELSRLGELLASRFQLTGVVGIDVGLSEGHWWVLEVNPRYPASAELLEGVLPRGVIAWHVAAASDGELPHEERIGRPWPAAKRVVYAAENGRWTSAVETQWRLHLADRGDCRLQLADVPVPGTRFSLGDPVCTVLGWAPHPHADSSDRLIAVVDEAIDGLSLGRSD